MNLKDKPMKDYKIKIEFNGMTPSDCPDPYQSWFKRGIYNNTVLSKLDWLDSMNLKDKIVTPSVKEVLTGLNMTYDQLLKIAGDGEDFGDSVGFEIEKGDVQGMLLIFRGDIRFTKEDYSTVINGYEQGPDLSEDEVWKQFAIERAGEILHNNPTKVIFEKA